MTDLLLSGESPPTYENDAVLTFIDSVNNSITWNYIIKDNEYWIVKCSCVKCDHEANVEWAALIA